MRVKVHYTIDTVYDFDEDYLRKSNEGPLSTARELIKHDFLRIETRADNVIPEYTSNIHFTFGD